MERYKILKTIKSLFDKSIKKHKINFTQLGYENTLLELIEVYDNGYCGGGFDLSDIDKFDLVNDQIYYIFNEAIPSGCRDCDIWTEADEAKKQQKELNELLKSNATKTKARAI